MACLTAIDSLDFTRNVNEQLWPRLYCFAGSEPSAPQLPAEVTEAIFEANKETYKMQRKIDRATMDHSYRLES
jgi:hypothetical protein